MANEFHYCVSLSIVHPTVDPKWISGLLAELRPRIETMAGTERRGRDGKLLLPARRAAQSHWLADLHEQERLYSRTEPLSKFVMRCLSGLEKHRALFADLRKVGQVQLVIGWFSDSNHSAGIFEADMLQKCGDLGMDIELDYYCPSSGAQTIQA